MNSSTNTISVEVVLLQHKPTSSVSASNAGYNILGSLSTTLDHETTPTNAGLTLLDESPHHVLGYSFAIFAMVAFISVITFTIYCIRRRNKLDRIRHRLMPMYTFDPADDEARWEADLIEDDREQQIALNSIASDNRPKLKFHSRGLDT